MAVTIAQLNQATYVDVFQILMDHTVPAGVLNSCLLVLMAAGVPGGPGIPLSLNYGPGGAGALSRFAEIGEGPTQLVIFYRVEPPAGTNQLNVIWASAPAVCVTLLLLAGVNTTVLNGPLYAGAFSSSGNGNSDILAISGLIPPGGMIFDLAVITTDPGPVPSWTPGAGQTARSDQTTASGTLALRGAVSTRTAPPAQMAFTLSGFAQFQHAGFVVSPRPVIPGPPLRPKGPFVREELRMRGGIEIPEVPEVP